MSPPPPPDENMTVGELARAVRDAFVRMEGIARRLEDGQFVRTDLYNLAQQNLQQLISDLVRRISAVETDKVSKTEFQNLQQEVNDLKDDKKWLVRLILGFIVLAILGAVFAASGGASP